MRLPCPKCKGARSLVVDSRPTSYGVRRRRECPVCLERWSTVESAKDPENTRAEIDKLLQKIEGIAYRARLLLK